MGIFFNQYDLLFHLIQYGTFRTYPDDISSLMGATGIASIVVENIDSALGKSSIDPGNPSVDSMRIRIDFPDQAICKAAALVMGTVDSSFSGWTAGQGSFGSLYSGNRCDDSIPWITTQFVFK